MLEYRSEQKFSFKETDYVSGPTFTLKDVKYIKEDRIKITPPSQVYNVYQHDKLDPIGTASIAFIDNADEVLQGVVTFSINKPSSDVKYAYNIVRLLKEVARSYDIDVIYYLPSPDYMIKDEEIEKLRAKTFYEDGIMYYKIKVERL